MVSVITINNLPIELLVFCFVPLSFHDRVRVSHVSRRWRSTATAFPQLCDALKFHHKPEHREMLLSALRRAGTAPLDATWKFAGPSFGGFDLLDANIARVRTLTVDAQWYHDDEGLRRLLARPLPVLESLRLDGAYTLDIPIQWGGDGAPKLRELMVWRFRFHPDASEFRALRCFHGEVDDWHNQQFDPRRIFKLCPALEELELTGIKAHTMQCLADGPIPLTLTTLSLLLQQRDDFGHSPSDKLHYAPLFHTLGGMPRAVTVTHATDFRAALNHYSTYARNPFCVTWLINRPAAVSGRVESFDTRLECAELGSLTCSMSNVSGALDRVPDLVPYLHHISHLECPTEVFDRLLRLRPTLPALYSLTLLLQGERPYGDLNYCHFHRHGHLVVPRLRSLTVDTTNAHPDLACGALRWFSCTLPARVTQFLRFDAARLETTYYYLHRDILRAPVVVSGEFLSWVERAFVGCRADRERALFQKGTWYTGEGPQSV